MGTVPDVLGLVWPSFRPKSGSKSKITGRIFTRLSISDSFFIFNCGSGRENGHDPALTFVYGANFGCVLHHFSCPARWNGSRGQVRPGTGPNRPNTILRLLLLISGSSSLHVRFAVGLGPEPAQSRPRTRPTRGNGGLLIGFG